MTNRKKALIINCCYTSNFGDQAIGVTMKSLFEKKGFDVDLFDLIRVDGAIDPDRFYNEAAAHAIDPLRETAPAPSQTLYAKLTKALAVPRWKQKNGPRIDGVCKNGYDIALIGGGELIQSNAIFPAAIERWTAALKRRSPRTSLVFFGVGVTNTYTATDKRHIAKALARADAVFVRDRSSADNLKTVFGRSAERISDVVLGGYDKQAAATAAGNTVLYGITSFSRLKRYHYKHLASRRAYYEDCYRELLDAGYLDADTNLKLLYSDTQDFSECHAFARYVQQQYGKTVAVCSFKTLQGFEQEIAASDVVISPRMHACIFGLIYGKDVRPICISPKTQTFYEEYVQTPPPAEVLREALSAAADTAIRAKGERS